MGLLELLPSSRLPQSLELPPFSDQPVLQLGALPYCVDCLPASSFCVPIVVNELYFPCSFCIWVLPWQTLTRGVFRPVKSASSLAFLVWIKYNVELFIFFFIFLVRFAFTLPFLHVNQKLLRSSFIGSSIQLYQFSFGTGPGPPFQLGLSTVDWSAPECDCCIHTCPKVPHQRGKRT